MTNKLPLVDPRKLIFFACAVENGSIKKAASVLNITQPSMSAALSRLEHEIGEKLLDRSSSGVIPTRFGDKVYAHARLIRDEVDLFEQLVADWKADRYAAVRMGALPSLAATIVPTALANWRIKYPREPLHVVEKVQIELLQALIKRDLDFAIGITDSYDLVGGLKQRVLFRDQLRVIARFDHELLSKPSLSWTDLAAYPWVCPPSGHYRSLIEEMLVDMGHMPPDTITVSSSIAMLKSILLKSDSLALLASHAALTEIREGRMACLPLSAPRLKRNVALIVRDGYELDPQNRDLVESIRSAGLEICREPPID
ncbi:LysR family pca operon transcriptional activator [Rhizobium sp. SLBN-94]|nr:LysR family pca operon transcriptional activator [Rhizobium sp. SLBN-94]